ncbi:hypothetical protein K1719_020805 [Acacia pycnantha]|nr:hypothetical protein K1719_020805 [Acacia pycnantha]
MKGIALNSYDTESSQHSIQKLPQKALVTSKVYEELKTNIMKGLALNSYHMESSQHSIHKLPQKALVTPKSGNNLERFLYDGVFASLFRLNMDIDKSNNQNGMKRRRVQCSPISCMLHINAKGNSFGGRQATNAFPTFVIDDVHTSYCLVVKDSIDSIEESTQLRQENLVIGNDYEHTIEKLFQEKLMVEDLEEPKEKQMVEDLEEPKLLTILRDPSKSSQWRPKKEDKKRKPTQEFLDGHIDENSLSRPVIPTGPTSQAKLPKDPLKYSQSRPRKEDKKKKPTQEFSRSHAGENSLRRPDIPVGPMFQANLPKDPLESSQSKPKKEDKKKETTPEFLCFHVGENSLRRPIIPIGPMFQANLPK